MTNNQGRNQRRLADMTIKPQESTHAWQPALDECEQYEYDFALGDSGDTCHVRMVCDRQDRLVEFALIQMMQVNGRTVKVARVCTDHDRVHIHQYRNDDTEEVRNLFAIRSQQDVEDGYNQGVDFIEAQWEENKRRWNDGS